VLPPLVAAEFPEPIKLAQALSELGHPLVKVRPPASPGIWPLAPVRPRPGPVSLLPAAVLQLLAAISLLPKAIVILGPAVSLRPTLALSVSLSVSLAQRGPWAERGPELVVCVHQPSPTGSCLTLL
jgi:hypothetical protein